MGFSAGLIGVGGWDILEGIPASGAMFVGWYGVELEEQTWSW